MQHKTIFSIILFVAITVVAAPVAMKSNPIKISVVQAAPPISSGAWTQMTNTMMTSVAPTGADNRAVVTAWSGATVDTKRSRLIVVGGGHGDYDGNEIYAYDAVSAKILRLTDPSTNTSNPNCASALSDGKPASRHTYGGLAYLAHADKLFMINGSRNPCGDHGPDAWTFDFATNKWEKKTSNPQNMIDNIYIGVVAAYDSLTKLVYIVDQTGFYSYNLEQDKYTQIAADYAGYHLSAAIDTKRRSFIIMGDAVNNNSTALHGVVLIDIATGNRKVLKTTGGDAVVNADSPGISYDPTLDRLIAWNGASDLYFLNLDTGVWTKSTPAKGPTSAAQTNGTFGRFSYIPNLGIHVILNAAGENVFAYKP